MFKKKKPEEPLARRRPVQTASQSGVFSYHAARSGQVNPSADRKPQLADIRRPVRRKLPTINPKSLLASIIILTIFLLSVGLDNTPKVVIIGDESAQLFAQESTEYQNAAKKLLGSSVLNNNKLTIDTAVVAQKLKLQFPEIREVSISLPVAGRQPVVYVQPATPQLILQSQSGGQYVVDGSGRALAIVTPALKLPKDAQALPVIQDQSNLKVTVGKIVLPSDNVGFISDVASQLRAKNIAIESWSLPVGSNELHAKVAGSPYFIKFNLRGDSQEQSGALVATSRYLARQSIVPAEYIDIRVKGRAYYR